MFPNVRRTAAIAAIALLTACSSSSGAPSGEFPSAPYATLVSDGGSLHIELRTAPDQPPTRGTGSIQLRVADAASGAPREDVTIEIVPWMPAMGHGSSIRPDVAARGGGVFVLTNMALFMPGRWELRITFHGGVTDSATPSLDVL